MQPLVVVKLPEQWINGAGSHCQAMHPIEIARFTILIDILIWLVVDLPL
jgi:hypothetical protein